MEKFTLESTNFQEKFKGVFKENLCKTLDQNNSIELCNQHIIAQKSLYTVSIYILENMRKYSYLSSKSEKEKLEIVNSSNFKILGKIQKK